MPVARVHANSWTSASPYWRTPTLSAIPVGPIHPDLVRSLHPKILQCVLLSERELDELDLAARAHLDNPGTLAIPHLYVQFWGRKPSAQGSSLFR
jgi:hypothetical protein